MKQNEVIISPVAQINLFGILWYKSLTDISLFPCKSKYSKSKKVGVELSDAKYQDPANVILYHASNTPNFKLWSNIKWRPKLQI